MLTKFIMSIVFCTKIPLLSGYVQLSSLKSKIFHKILTNKKIKTDFKKITSNDAYQLSSFWHDELLQTTKDEARQHHGISLLYQPTNHIYKNSVNLTDMKYNIISDIENKHCYYIWRPKIQICLPSMYAIRIKDDESNSELKRTLLYPSFRETMYLISVEMNNHSNGAIIANIVQSPYWNEPQYDSYDILQFSLENFFVNYLKYPSLKYK